MGNQRKETEQVPYQASPVRVADEARCEAIATLDRAFDEQARDQQAVLRLQKRIYARNRHIASLCDQVGGSTLLQRHYGQQAVLTYANPKALR
jgi:hypothetical protein